MYKIKTQNLAQFYAKASECYNFYLPVDSETGARFKAYQDGDKWSDAVNTQDSVKRFFFPQTENLVDFKMKGKSIEIIDTRSESQDFIVFGVRACDEAALQILDKVFLVNPVDTYYKNRRNHGVIITTSCSQLKDSCFCSAFNIDSVKPLGDIRTHKTKEYVYFEPLTEKGQKVIEKVADVLIECEQVEVKEHLDECKKAVESSPLNGLQPKDFTKEQLQNFNSEKWKELSASCVGCGTCTFVCPTCQCYDIRDFDTGNGVKRFRCWDSCMYSDFTLMAHGTPRLTQLERFRQRFMHKLVYFPMNNDGIYGCVGCGRCLDKCPISMNIVKVMKSLGEDK